MVEARAGSFEKAINGRWPKFDGGDGLAPARRLQQQQGRSALGAHVTAGVAGLSILRWQAPWRARKQRQDITSWLIKN